jgi:hypothetical protein
LVESRIVIPVVVGSSPISHPNQNKHLAQASSLWLFAFWAVTDCLQTAVQGFDTHPPLFDQVNR